MTQAHAMFRTVEYAFIILRVRSQGWWVNDVPLWCINIEEAKPLNLLPFHFDNFPMRSEFLRKLKIR